jgi:hypothetical protein
MAHVLYVGKYRSCESFTLLNDAGHQLIFLDDPEQVHNRLLSNQATTVVVWEMTIGGCNIPTEHYISDLKRNLMYRAIYHIGLCATEGDKGGWKNARCDQVVTPEGLLEVVRRASS